MEVSPTALAAPESSYMVIPTILVTPASPPASPTTQPLICPAYLTPNPSSVYRGLPKIGDAQCTLELPLALSIKAFDPQSSSAGEHPTLHPRCTARTLLNVPLPTPLALSSAESLSSARLSQSEKDRSRSSRLRQSAGLRQACSSPLEKTTLTTNPLDTQYTLSETVCASIEEPCTKDSIVSKHHSLTEPKLPLTPIPEVAFQTQSQQTRHQRVALPKEQRKNRLPQTNKHHRTPLTQKHLTRDVQPHDPEKAQQALNRRLIVTKSLHDLSDSNTSWKTLFTSDDDDDVHAKPRPASFDTIETCKRVPARPLRHKKAIADLRGHIVTMEAEKKKRREEDAEKEFSVLEKEGRRDGLGNCLDCVVEGEVSW